MANSNFWTAHKNNLVIQKVRAFNRAIELKERQLIRTGNEELIGALPNKVTVEEIKNIITPNEDNIIKRDANNRFRQLVGYKNSGQKRPSYLDRITKPNALDFKTSREGGIQTNFDYKETGYARTAIKKQAKQTGVDLEKDLDEMSAPEYAKTVDGTDIAHDEGEPDEEIEDIDPQTKTKWVTEDLFNKRYKVTPLGIYNVYRDVWLNQITGHTMIPGYKKLIEALDWLAENHPSVLNKAFNSTDPEVEINYIIDSGKNNPWIGEKFETRHRRAIEYWVRLAEENGWHHEKD